MIAPNGIQVTSYFSNVATQTTDYSASVQDSGIFVNAVSGNLVVTLPPISSAFDSPYGIILSVKKVDATTNLVTIVGSGSDTVEGVANYILGAQNASVTLQASASGWLVMASSGTSSGPAFFTGLVTCNEGIAIPTGAPTSTTGTLYQIGNVLYFNGSPVSSGSSPSNNNLALVMAMVMG